MISHPFEEQGGELEKTTCRTFDGKSTEVCISDDTNIGFEKRRLKRPKWKPSRHSLPRFPYNPSHNDGISVKPSISASLSHDASTNHSQRPPSWRHSVIRRTSSLTRKFLGRSRHPHTTPAEDHFHTRPSLDANSHFDRRLHEHGHNLDIQKCHDNHLDNIDAIIQEQHDNGQIETKRLHQQANTVDGEFDQQILKDRIAELEMTALEASVLRQQVASLEWALDAVRADADRVRDDALAIIASLPTPCDHPTCCCSSRPQSPSFSPS